MASSSSDLGVDRSLTLKRPLQTIGNTIAASRAVSFWATTTVLNERSTSGQRPCNGRATRSTRRTHEGGGFRAGVRRRHSGVDALARASDDVAPASTRSLGRQTTSLGRRRARSGVRRRHSGVDALARASDDVTRASDDVTRAPTRSLGRRRARSGVRRRHSGRRTSQGRRRARSGVERRRAGVDAFARASGASDHRAQAPGIGRASAATFAGGAWRRLSPAPPGVRRAWPDRHVRSRRRVQTASITSVKTGAVARARRVVRSRNLHPP